MNIPHRYKAKALDHDRWYEGYYFKYPETTYCVAEDYKDSDPRILHCLIFHTVTDWGLPNKLEYVEIDPSTLEAIDKTEENDIPPNARMAIINIVNKHKTRKKFIDNTEIARKNEIDSITCEIGAMRDCVCNEFFDCDDCDRCLQESLDWLIEE